MSGNPEPNPAGRPRYISGNASTSIMARQLIPWSLDDLSGAHAPDSLDTMRDYFRRFRKLRGKGLDGIEHEALQRSWCAFIQR